MRDKTVADVMTPLESVFMLDINGVIDTVTMNEVPAKRCGARLERPSVCKGDLWYEEHNVQGTFRLEGGREECVRTTTVGKLGGKSVYVLPQ